MGERAGCSREARRLCRSCARKAYLAQLTPEERSRRASLGAKRRNYLVRARRLRSIATALLDGRLAVTREAVIDALGQAWAMGASSRKTREYRQRHAA